MYNINEALDILESKKLVNSKDYWKNNHTKLQHTDELIINMANYIKPYKEIVKVEPIKKVEYYETANKTRILKGDIKDFKIGCNKQGIPNNKLPIKNGTNLTFFHYGENPDKTKNYWATSILYANGAVQGSWEANHMWDNKKKQSVLVKYKDGRVEMPQLANVTELNLGQVDWAVGGVGLRNKDTYIRYEDEGFDMTVAYKTWKTLIGYSQKENRMWLITRPSIANRKSKSNPAYDLNDLARDYPELDYVLIVDGGGSTEMYVNGKAIVGSTRRIHSYAYFD